jgi:uroporphyrinogen-III synthase
MRILLTSAKADAERTAMRLEALGHTALISPVIEIVPTGATLPSGRFDAVIATSAHALVDGTGSLTNMPLFAVGDRTREAARRMDWHAPIHVGQDAKALIAHLRANSPDTRTVLYLAGGHRKPDIEAAAREIGLELKIIETYVAHDIPSLSEDAERTLRTEALDGVLHYSRRSAELFIALAQRAELWARAAERPHFALSPDVAEPLAAAGAQVYVAARPDEDHLLALLTDAERR